MNNRKVFFDFIDNKLGVFKKVFFKNSTTKLDNIIKERSNGKGLFEIDSVDEFKLSVKTKLSAKEEEKFIKVIYNYEAFLARKSETVEEITDEYIETTSCDEKSYDVVVSEDKGNQSEDDYKSLEEISDVEESAECEIKEYVDAKEHIEAEVADLYSLTDDSEFTVFADNEDIVETTVLEGAKEAFEEISDVKETAECKTGEVEEIEISEIAVDNLYSLMDDSEFTVFDNDEYIAVTASEEIEESVEETTGVEVSVECNTNGDMYNAGECRDTFAAKYNINPEEYRHNYLNDYTFTNRTINRIAKYNTVENLLNTTEDELLKITGFGSSSLSEVNEFIINIKSESDTEIAKESTQSENIAITKEILDNRKEVLSGNFNFFEKSEDSKTRYAADYLEKAYENIGPDLIKAVSEDVESIKILSEIFSYISMEARTLCAIKECADNLPDDRQYMYVSPYIKAFCVSRYSGQYEEHEVADIIMSYYGNLNSKLKDINIGTSMDTDLVKAFLNWCRFDVSEEFSSFISTVEDTRAYKFLYNRAKGITLEEIGRGENITRERVRQMEKKVVDKFMQWYTKHPLLLMISACRNNDTVLTDEELYEYFGPYTGVAVYLMRKTGAVYDVEHKLFMIGDNNDVLETNEEYIENLPVFIADSELKGIVSDAEKAGIAEELFFKSFENSYRKTETGYVRIKVTKTEIYKDVMNRYYSDGCNIYDEKTISDIRKLILRNYGDVMLPSNDRAIYARLGDISILCGRGKYKPKKDRYISDELMSDIIEYIDNEELNILPEATIFEKFRKRLVSEGVDNRYYLHGIIKESYPDKYEYRRDYICKINAVGSFYNEIVDFVKESRYPVEKQTIRKRYPGVTEIVISLALSDKNILNLFGTYLHASNLDMDTSKKEYLKKVVLQFTESDAVNSRFLFSFIENDNKSILTSLGINNQFALFSVLKYFFDEEFEFKRPFIGKKGTELLHPNDEFAGILKNTTIMDVDDIKEFFREKNVQIINLMDFINGLSDTHLFMNKSQLIKEEMVGITDEIIVRMEEIFCGELNSTIAINELKSVCLLPPLNIPWNEWLIYSIIRKYSDRLEVGVTDRQFRSAVPLIAKKGELDTDNVNTYNLENKNGDLDSHNNPEESSFDIFDDEMEYLW